MPILNNFGFGIVGAKEIEGYVSLNHNTRYRLKLWNFDRKFRCDATITIDGQEVGVWRINPNQSIINLSKNLDFFGKVVVMGEI